MTATEAPPDELVVHVLWINAGLSCDGDSVALTAATQPTIEEIALGALPGLPKIAVHWPLIDFECGPNGGADDFLEWFFKGARGRARAVRARCRGLDPQRADQRQWLLGRLRQQPGYRPADDSQRLAGPPHASRRSRCSLSARARPMAAFTQWPAIRPVRWASPITSGGDGSRRREFRSSAYPGVRRIPTTWRRPSPICCTRPPARRR